MGCGKPVSHVSTCQPNPGPYSVSRRHSNKFLFTRVRNCWKMLFAFGVVRFRHIPSQDFLCATRSGTSPLSQANRRTLSLKSALNFRQSELPTCSRLALRARSSTVALTGLCRPLVSSGMGSKSPHKSHSRCVCRPAPAPCRQRRWPNPAWNSHLVLALASQSALPLAHHDHA